MADTDLQSYSLECSCGVKMEVHSADVPEDMWQPCPKCGNKIPVKFL